MSFNDLPLEVLTLIACELEKTFHLVCRRARDAGYYTAWQFELPPDEPLQSWQLALLSKIRGQLVLESPSGTHAAANLTSALQLVQSAGELDLWLPGGWLPDVHAAVVAARPRGFTNIRAYGGNLTIGTAHRPGLLIPAFELACDHLLVQGCDPAVRGVECDTLVSAAGANNLPNLRRLRLSPRICPVNGRLEPHNVPQLVAEVRGLTSLHINLWRAMDLSALLGHTTALHNLVLEHLDLDAASAVSSTIATALPSLPGLRLGFEGAVETTVTLSVSETLRHLTLSNRSVGVLAIDRPERLRHLVLRGGVRVQTETLARMFGLRTVRLDYSQEALLMRTADTLARVAVGLFRIEGPKESQIRPGYCPGFTARQRSWCTKFVRHASK